jgi:hypothetical protein
MAMQPAVDRNNGVDRASQCPTLHIRHTQSSARERRTQEIATMRQRDIETRIRDTADRAGEHARYYADQAGTGARSLAERGRALGARFSKRGHGYSRQLANKAEDFADEANYHYRRMRRQVSRHPVAAVAIVAGTVGAFLLLSRVFRSHGDED